MADSRLTRARILQVTAKILNKNGEKAVNIRDVCKASKTTPPTVYRLFGSRTGLIMAAQSYRFTLNQTELIEGFATAVYGAKNKSEFVKIAHQNLKLMVSQKRKDYRSMRTEVLGTAQSNKNLAVQINKAQTVANELGAQPFRFAQARGWINDDFDPEIYIAWLTGMVNARVIIELNGKHPKSAEWDKIAMRSICAVLGIPEPKKVKGVKTS
ncbi:MAG: TetR/AcrR family transcriptional regulator [Actinomycetota bacterium]